jgi:hypothetical protein
MAFSAEVKPFYPCSICSAMLSMAAAAEEASEAYAVVKFSKEGGNRLLIEFLVSISNSFPLSL